MTRALIVWPSFVFFAFSEEFSRRGSIVPAGIEFCAISLTKQPALKRAKVRISSSLIHAGPVKSLLWHPNRYLWAAAASRCTLRRQHQATERVRTLRLQTFENLFWSLRVPKIGVKKTKQKRRLAAHARKQ